MRSIKFRGKVLISGAWIYGDGVNVHYHNIVRAWICVSGGSHIEVDPSTVGQYTGINDCKDKEIYEGDTVLAYGRKWKVFFSQGCFVVKSGRSVRALKNIYCEVIA